MDGFIYTRLCIFLLRFAPAWLRGSYGRRYAISVVLAGCMGFHAGGLSDHGSGEGRGQVPNGIVAMWGIRMASLGAGRMVGVYLGLTAVLALSLWTLDKLWRRENSSIGRSRIHAAPRIGTSTDIPCAQPLLDHVYAHASPDPPQALSKQHLPNIDTPPLTRSSSTMSEHDVIFATPGLKTPADELGDPSSTVVLPGFFTGDTRIPHAGSLKERRNAFENGAKKKASVAIQKVCDLHDDD